MEHYRMMIGGDRVSSESKEYMFRGECYRDPGKLIAFQYCRLPWIQRFVLRTFHSFIHSRDPDLQYAADFISVKGFPQYSRTDLERCAFSSITIGSNHDNMLAIQAAQDASRGFGALSIDKRGEILDDFRERLSSHRERLRDIAFTVGFTNLFDWSYQLLISSVLNPESIQIYKQHLVPRQLSESSSLHYEPFGVIGILLPYNSAMLEGLWPIMAALLAGNACVVRMPRYPVILFEALSLLEESLHQHAAPEGTLNAVTGSSKEIVGEWIRDDSVQCIVAYGNSRTGLEIGANTLQKAKKAVLELAGSDPVLVWEDVDVNRVVEHVIEGRFMASGQACIAIKRAYVHQAIHDEFVEKLVKGIADLPIVDFSKADVDMISQVPIGSIKALTRLTSMVNDAVGKGAILAGGGQRMNHAGEVDELGLFFQPTVLTRVHHDMEVMNEETFGPILPVMAVSDMDEAIQHINSSPYGLRASVWAHNSTVVDRFIKEINAGAIIVNAPHWTFEPASTHLGGTKFSGITGAKYFHEEMCYKKYTYLSKTPD